MKVAKEAARYTVTAYDQMFPCPACEQEVFLSEGDAGQDCACSCCGAELDYDADWTGDGWQGGYGVATPPIDRLERVGVAS